MALWKYYWDRVNSVWRDRTKPETPIVPSSVVNKELVYKGGAFRNPLGQFVSRAAIEYEEALKRELPNVGMTVQRFYANINPFNSIPKENELIGVEITLATPEGEFVTANIYAPRRGEQLSEDFVNEKIAEWTKSKEIYTEYDVRIEPGLQFVSMKAHITVWE